VAIVLLVLLIILSLWGYKRDKRDEINYEKITSDKNKLFTNLNLEPNIIAKKESIHE
jgi:hypothetical protein